MHTITIELDNKALALIQELEELKVLKIIKNNNVKNGLKLSQKDRGVFYEKDSKDFNIHTENMRKEWGNI